MLQLLLSTSLVYSVSSRVLASQYEASNLPYINDCNFHCIIKPMPPLNICAFDGISYKIFNDDCLLRRANCTSGYKLQKSPIEKCREPRTFIDFCNFPCPNIGRSVCGQNKDGNAKLFKNGCVMGREACKERTKYKRVDINTCKVSRDNEVCHRECPLEYKPRCGFNGTTYAVFGNDCDLDVANCLQGNTWSPVHLQTCDQKLGFKFEAPEIADDLSDGECPKVCRSIFWPVCGFDGVNYKVFTNECLLMREHCEKNINWKKVNMSDCIIKNLTV